MKWFWAIVGVLAIATAAWLAWAGMNAPAPPVMQGASSLDAVPPPATEPASVGSARQPEPVEPAPAKTEPASAEPAPAPAAQASAAPAASNAALVDQWLKGLNDLQQKATAAEKALPSPAAPPAAAKQEDAPGKLADAGSGAKGGGPKWGEVVPARKSEQPDGSIVYDERFPLTGKGTADSPYIVTWEFLVSASETYQPRLGKKRLPERITVLDGHYVRVVGYVAFPILATSPTEMLSMRNMWDGCCIGVPPTPYDAIEVRLKEPATPQEKLMRFGSVEGKFSVDPYVKDNWLLGLYVMDDAKVSEAKNAGL